MTKSQAAREEFSFDVRKDLKSPRGEEHALRSAIEALGRFQFENRLDALQSDCVRTREGKRVVICHDEAQRLVRNLASIYLEAKHMYERAPRIQEHMNKLKALDRSVKKAIDCLTELDDFNVFELYSAVLPDRRAAGLDIEYELPLPSKNASAPLIERLKSFHLLVSAALAYGEDTFARGSRGGKMNVFTVLRQSPREVLAREAIFIFEIFTGKGARTHQDSEFLSFVNAVHEYATGIDAEESGMRHAVANAVRQELERREYVADIEGQLATLEELPRNKSRDEFISFLREQKYNNLFSPRSLTYDS